MGGVDLDDVATPGGASVTRPGDTKAGVAIAVLAVVVAESIAAEISILRVGIPVTAGAGAGARGGCGNSADNGLNSAGGASGSRLSDGGRSDND
jgi:hypothetical protein